MEPTSHPAPAASFSCPYSAVCRVVAKSPHGLRRHVLSAHSAAPDLIERLAELPPTKAAVKASLPHHTFNGLRSRFPSPYEIPPSDRGHFDPPLKEGEHLRYESNFGLIVTPPPMLATWIYLRELDDGRIVLRSPVNGQEHTFLAQLFSRWTEPARLYSLLVLVINPNTPQHWKKSSPRELAWMIQRAGWNEFHREGQDPGEAVETLLGHARDKSRRWDRAISQVVSRAARYPLRPVAQVKAASIEPGYVVIDTARGYFEVTEIKTYSPGTLNSFPNGAISFSNGVNPYRLTLHADELTTVLLPRPSEKRALPNPP
jgi:hypothetical protein